MLEYAYGRRAQASLGAEFGAVAIPFRPVSLRFGMYGMVTLENDERAEIFPHDYWRGMVGFSAALSLDALARAWFEKNGGVELGLTAGHESDHRTDHERPSSGTVFFGVKNFLSPDLAVRAPLGTWGRVQSRFSYRLFVASTYAHAGGFELEFRWRALTWLQPTAAGYGEYLVGAQGEPNCAFGRALAGVAFIGRVGEVTPFVSGESGCGAGLLARQTDSQILGGVRYAPF